MVEKSHTSGFWPSIYEPLRTATAKLADWIAPASEASSDDGAYRISLELPGVEADDIEVTAHDGAVVVRGEKRTTREESGETWYFSERQYGSFSRSFRLPPDADSDRIGADLKDGVLTLSVPRKTAASGGPGQRVTINRG